MSPVLRSATPDEESRTIATIVASFLTDPLSRFIWPTLPEYFRGQPVVTHTLAGSAFFYGSADITHDFRAVSIWMPPGEDPDYDALFNAVNEGVPADRRDDALGTLEEMSRTRPTYTCWFYTQLGAEPMSQRMGLATALLARGVERCDRDKLPAYLESSNPRNVPFYRRFGFEVIREIQIGRGPQITPMLRPARQP